jgi:hypothetical protein
MFHSRLPPHAGVVVQPALSKAALVLLVVLPLLKLALHLAVGPGYGYHGDELYYLVCADHLDWAYVDHPPVSIFVLAVTR